MEYNPAASVAASVSPSVAANVGNLANISSGYGINTATAVTVAGINSSMAVTSPAVTKIASPGPAMNVIAVSNRTVTALKHQALYAGALKRIVMPKQHTMQRVEGQVIAKGVTLNIANGASGTVEFENNEASSWCISRLAYEGPAAELDGVTIQLQIGSWFAPTINARAIVDCESGSGQVLLPSHLVLLPSEQLNVVITNASGATLDANLAITGEISENHSKTQTGGGWPGAPYWESIDCGSVAAAGTYTGDLEVDRPCRITEIRMTNDGANDDMAISLTGDSIIAPNLPLRALVNLPWEDDKLAGTIPLFADEDIALVVTNGQAATAFTGDLHFMGVSK